LPFWRLFPTGLFCLWLKPDIRVKRRHIVHQKFEISKDHCEHTYKIKEYAVIDKRLNNVDPLLLKAEDYALLHEETYEEQIIDQAIHSGMPALVTALRTPFFFPNTITMAGIAECVASLYQVEDSRSIELFQENERVRKPAA